MGRSEGECKRATLNACSGKAEEGAVAEPRRLTTTRSRVRSEWGAACSPSDLAIWNGRTGQAARTCDPGHARLMLRRCDWSGAADYRDSLCRAPSRPNTAQRGDGCRTCSTFRRTIDAYHRYVNG